MKNKTNSNTLRDTSIKILRPRSVFKKESGPIKIISKTTKNKDRVTKKLMMKIKMLISSKIMEGLNLILIIIILWKQRKI